MKRNRWALPERLLCILSAIAFTLGVAGCGASAAQGPITLEFWSFQTGSEGEYLDKAVKDYNNKHTDVHIDHKVINQSDYSTTAITIAFANGAAPDIFYVEPATFTKFAGAGMLADLDPYYSPELEKDILPSMLESAKFGGKKMALPFEMDLLGLYYDKDVLNEAGISPPTTWQELQEDAKKLTNDKRYGLVLPVEKSGYTLYDFYPFMWMQNAGVTDEKGNVTVNSPGMVKALDFWGSFFKDKTAPRSLQIGPWDSSSLSTHTSAMQVSGSFAINDLETKYSNVHIGVVPLPTPDGKHQVTVAGGQKLAVSSKSKHIKEAAAFIFSLYGDTENEDFASQWVTKAKFAYPARRSIIKRNQKLYNKGLRAEFTKMYDGAKPELSLPAEATDAMGDALQGVMFAGQSGKSAADHAQQVIEKSIGSRIEQ